MFWVFSNPFWPSILAAVTTAAALFFGIFDARRINDDEPGRGWLGRCVFVYGIPFLFVGFIAVAIIFNAHVHNIFEPGPAYQACAGKECRDALVHARDATFFSSLAIAQSGVIAGMALLLFVRLAIHKSSASRSGVPDPRKWHFNKETGEYHRITAHYKGHVQYETDNYATRVMAHRKASEEFSMAVRMTMLSFIIGIFALSNALGSSLTTGAALIGYGVTFICAIGLVFGAFGILVGIMSKLTDTLGPPPVAPSRGREDVDRQKAYGEGGFATRPEIDAAARGNAGRGHADEQEFLD